MPSPGGDLQPVPPGGHPPGVNALAIVAFVLAFAVPPGAIACGQIALGQIRRSGEQGHGLALAATVIGWILSGLIALFVVLWLAVLGAVLLGWLAFIPFALR